MISYEYGAILTEVEEKYMDMLRSWRNDPSVYHWCRQTGLVDELSQDKWFKKISEDPSIQMFLINSEDAMEYIEDSRVVVGVCGLTTITPAHNTAEFSIYINEDNRQNGYGEAALKTLVRYGFNTLNLNRIWGETFDSNPGVKLYKRLGFSYEGTLRETYYKKGKYINSHIYSILKKDYTPNINT